MTKRYNISFLFFREDKDWLVSQVDRRIEEWCLVDIGLGSHKCCDDYVHLSADD